MARPTAVRTEANQPGFGRLFSSALLDTTQTSYRGKQKKEIFFSNALGMRPMRKVQARRHQIAAPKESAWTREYWSWEL